MLELPEPVTVTGIGSVPGTSVTGWPGRILEQIPLLPHVPELPQRGPGADMIGRTLGLLSQISPDFGASTTVTGWELTGAGKQMRLARSLMIEDLDAVEQEWDGYEGLAKQQLAGPYTLAASVDYRGRRLLADPGLLAELVQAWRQMAVEHRAQLQRRVSAKWLLQMDEPFLSAVVGGSVRTVSGLGSYPAVQVDFPLGADLLHSCGANLPWDVLSVFDGILFDVSLNPSADTELAGLSERGATLGFGVLGNRESAQLISRFYDRTGVDPQPLLVTPPCGMVGDYRPWRPVSEELRERLF